MSSKHGYFCWYDLNTTDIGAAAEFYKAVLGWKIGPWGDEPGKMPYAHVETAQGQMAGMTLLQERAKAMGAPPHWMGYVAVDDVDATAAKAVALGGKLHVAMDIPNTGRIAVLADPQGAHFALYKSLKDEPLHDVSQPGEFNWRELVTSDNVAAMAFYNGVFGWEQMEAMDMGPMGTYLVFGKDGKQFGGLMNKPKEMPACAWGYYVMVSDFDGALAKAKAAGGTVMSGPMPVPGGARIVQLLDPQGAFFALVGM